MGQEIPGHLWTKFVTDIFHFECSPHLLILDYTSRFSVACKLFLMTGLHVANHCKQCFSEYGWPETLTSDNGPCYTSQAFTSVMKSYSVSHITMSLHYPQSNGLVEKYVHIAKSLFYKMKEEDKDCYKCFMIYCDTPLQVVCSHQWRSSNAGMLDLTCLCQMQLENSLVYNLK